MVDAAAVVALPVPGSAVVVVVVAVAAPLSSVEDDEPVVVEATTGAAESAPVVLVSEVPLLPVVVPGRSFDVDVVVSTLLLGADAAVVATATVLEAACTVDVGSADPPPPQAVSAAVTSAAPRLALARNGWEDEYMALFW